MYDCYKDLYNPPDGVLKAEALALMALRDTPEDNDAIRNAYLGFVREVDSHLVQVAVNARVELAKLRKAGGPLTEEMIGLELIDIMGRPAVRKRFNDHIGQIVDAGKQVSVAGMFSVIARDDCSCDEVYRAAKMGESSDCGEGNDHDEG